MALDLDALDAGLLPDKVYRTIGDTPDPDRKRGRNPNPGMIKIATPDDRRMLDMRPRAGRLAWALIGELTKLDTDAGAAARAWYDRNEPTITVDQCSEWINRLRAKIATYNGQPVVTTTAPTGVVTTAPAFDAYDDVTDGNYAVMIEGDKTHFYRVSRRTHNGRTYVNVKERASDDLFRMSWPQSKVALDRIRAAGVDASHRMFSDRLGRCWNCFKSLTDDDNPYKVHGLGPDCGPKVMG